VSDEDRPSERDAGDIQDVPDARHRLTTAGGAESGAAGTGAGSGSGAPGTGASRVGAARSGAASDAHGAQGAHSAHSAHGTPDGSESTDLPHAPQLVIITGMSGAGRSTAAKVFEDLGWYVVDNLAPTLIAPMVDLVMRESGGTDRLAFVVDVRGRAFFDTLRSTLDELDSAGLNHRIVFLESDDDVLVRRYENVRRPHPLQGDGRLLDGIIRERKALDELRSLADTVIECQSDTRV